MAASEAVELVRTFVHHEGEGEEDEPDRLVYVVRETPHPEAILAQESVWAVFIAVVVSVFGALIAFATVCSEQHACLKAGTCYATSNSSYSCAFRTAITPGGWRMLNASDQWSSLQAMNRGVCSPGLRQSVDPATGDMECVRKRSYPNALNAEIGEPGASPDHRRWCGKWIDAKPIAVGEQKWAFFDEEHVAEDVEEVLLAGGSGRLGISDVTKFRSACRSMIASNAAGPAAQRAYEHLRAELDAYDGVARTVADGLKAIGLLASHYCDAPATAGLSYDAKGFVARVAVGATPGAEALREALYAAGADSSTRDRAAAFAERMAALVNDDADADADRVTDLQAQLVVLGSHQGTWIDGYMNAGFRVVYEAHNPPLMGFVRAFASPAEEGGGGSNAWTYLHGLAAYCAQASRSVVTGEFGGMDYVVTDARSIRIRRPAAAALGRLRGAAQVDIDRWAHLDETALFNASTITWSSLTGVPLASATRPQARSACLRAARVAFPDAFDHVAFDMLVTERLYDRLSTLTTRVKAAAQEALGTPLIGSLFATSAGKAHALSMLQATKLRVAGAPPGSWAGVDDEFRRPTLTSDDGALLIMLKQARAVFLDRLLRAVRGDGMCQHPPLFDALDRNAYLLLSTQFSCAMLLPGILVPPFADERYDEASLYARIGYVIAHEFMHVTAFRSQWDEDYASTLLHRYEPNTYIEAIADGGGVASVLRLGIAGLDNATLCGHVSQLWCGRSGWLAPTPEGGSHPRVNERGDYACAFLRENFS